MTEQYLSEPERFMLAIRERPDDDAPRLMYADWLKETGTDYARGEFIITQIRLAEMPPDIPLIHVERGQVTWRWTEPVEEDPFGIYGSLPTDALVPQKRPKVEIQIPFESWKKVIPGDAFRIRTTGTADVEQLTAQLIEAMPGYDGGGRPIWTLSAWPSEIAAAPLDMLLTARERLEAREQELIQNTVFWGVDLPFPALPKNGFCIWRRGFVDEIHCSTADFLDPGVTMFRMEPIRRVLLTDREPQEVPARRNSVGPRVRYRWHLGCDKGDFSRPTFSWWLPGELCDGSHGDDAIDFDSIPEANAWLSDRCVLYGRREAGLIQTRYVVRYEFAGATGSFGSVTTMRKAERLRAECERHFYGQANVRICEEEK